MAPFTVGVLFWLERRPSSLLVGTTVIVVGGCAPGVFKHRPRALPMVATALAALSLGGCGTAGGASSSRACGPPVHETLDALSTLHLLPGASEPAYRTDPPTSGAHRLGFYPRGILDQPVSRPTQVALLEKGSVVVQYRPDVPAAASLGILVNGDILVTVAPNPTLRAPVVATAWTWKVTCEAPSVPQIRKFVLAHQGHGPGTP
jgi:hypothetical protein